MMEIVSQQGQDYTFQNSEERDAVVAAAFEYRGDVTVRLREGDDVEGYLFNSEKKPGGGGTISLLSKGSETPQVLNVADIAGLIFSGKDTADGKSYATWLAKKESERATESKQIEEEMRDKGLL
jgi:hypothetical protein